MISITLCEKCSEDPIAKFGLHQIWYCKHSQTGYMKDFDSGSWMAQKCTREEAASWAAKVL
jgi:hypothetical protein